MKDRKSLIGIALIVFGMFFMLNEINLFHFGWGTLWPLFLLVPGIMFEYAHFVKRANPGVLVPGGILTTYSIIFFINGFLGYHLMEYMWPFFLIGPAFGLFQLYWFGGKEKALFWVSFGLATASILMFMITISATVFKYIVPGIIIFIGVKLLTDAGKPKKRKKNYDDF
ncbi:MULTISPECIES: LiaI-LiaF-like domain-containing protein [unclassified Fusibacter]|uniref:LiaI-LiaF-like domain-containing protein n=1 Tax=unclassified Fusibacter TaxID=2624464 RepID=UPI001012A41B|nr:MULTISPECIES: DUF5668 domain-containing protein [unclassified Fusibacter]MCK8061349.1 DUF5668 domain-containing protein [Fusibacter sp. A2]NPE23608.1 hypothetical protein [Fusibacter sp. A1]RXV59016.1 hypothetical protein DWB64_17620 [Fusibacter sp. A1]